MTSYVGQEWAGNSFVTHTMSMKFSQRREHDHKPKLKAADARPYLNLNSLGIRSYAKRNVS
jgi:hypothetical protein